MRSASLASVLVLVLVLAVAGAACDAGGPVAGSSPGPSPQQRPSPSPSPAPGIRFEVHSPLARSTAIGGLTVTADGSAWFTEVNRNAVGRLTADGRYTEYPLPTPDRQPQGIATGTDGGVWFAEESIAVNQIGHLSLDGTLAEYGQGITDTTQPWRIAAGTDGNLWFTEIGQQPPFTNRVGRITPAGRVTEFVAKVPDEIAEGPDGAMWFTAEGERLGRITPGGGVSYVNFTGGTPQGLVAGGDGALWLVLNDSPPDAARVSRVTPDGAETDFPVPGPARGLSSIALGGDGNLWFCDPVLHSLGRITTAGQVKEFALPALNMAPGLIAAGPGNTMWVSLTDGRLVRVTLPPA